MRVIFFSLGVLLLIGTAEGGAFSITAQKDKEGVKLTCTKGNHWKHNGVYYNDTATISLEYQDDKSGEYECFSTPVDDDDVAADSLGTYHVRFRTCDSCIQLDAPALAGIVVGNVVATVLIGVAVYFISTQSKGSSLPSNKASKESDRRNLISNDQTYQPLGPHGRDDYDVLHTRRR
ncbi:T-cell surface glycoprotein CD3 delta chain-like [Sardina pilchardus]|uniref:T-cell surface glycoprotein CD3 delta chain-like n=1 Tax=Sardina pilchardus TaxID=27697 RepID=UPI002E0D4881